MKKIMLALLLAALAATTVSAQEPTTPPTSAKLLIGSTVMKESSDIGLNGVVTYTNPDGSVRPAFSDGQANDWQTAQSFASASVYIYCDPNLSGSAWLSGDNGNITSYQSKLTVGNSLIVDNFIRVTTAGDPDGQDIFVNAPHQLFFNGSGIYPASSLAGTDYLGKDAAYATYEPVPDQQINLNLNAMKVGDSYTVSLMDWGYVHASTDVYVKTFGGCRVIDKVCHFDQGKRTWKEMTLDPDGIVSHLRVHDTAHNGYDVNGHSNADALGSCTPNNPPGKR